MISRAALFWRSALVVLAALIAINAWDLLTAIGLVSLVPNIAHDELLLYLAVKGSFALALCLAFSQFGLWRRFGFTGGLNPYLWPVLMPIWIAALASSGEGLGVHDAAEIAGWVLLAGIIGFGEEAVFRGVIVDALLGSPPVGSTLTASATRRAMLLSGLLFGLLHLSGLAIRGIDPQVIYGQSLFAGGIGVVLAWVRLRGASIWPGIVAHTVLDACGLIAGGGVEKALEAPVTNYVYLWTMGGLSIAWGLLLAWRWPVARGSAAH